MAERCGGVKILEKIEQRLGSWIEGVFRRRIPHQIEPVEVGRALLSAVERHKRVSVSRVYAPNKFSVRMSDSDLSNIRSLTRTLELELKGVLHEKAEKDKLCFIGPLSLTFEADPNLGRGQLEVEADYEEGAVTELIDELPDQDIVTDTQVYKRGILTAGYLVLEAGRASRPNVRLHDGLTIGRGASCDLVIDESNVSRVHA